MLSGIHACAYCKSKNYDGQIMSNESRAAFEAWAIGILGDNPTWRESGDCELAWAAWQASRKVALNEAADVLKTLDISGLKDDPYLLKYTSLIAIGMADYIRSLK
jgi:hypothetical protein